VKFTFTAPSEKVYLVYLFEGLVLRTDVPGGSGVLCVQESRMEFESFSFGSIRIDGITYESDVLIDRGEVHEQKKKPSKKFRDQFGHMPVSVEEKIPWRF